MFFYVYCSLKESRDRCVEITKLRFKVLIEIVSNEYRFSWEKVGKISVANQGGCLRRVSAFLAATPANRYALQARVSRTRCTSEKSRNEINISGISGTVAFLRRGKIIDVLYRRSLAH